MESVETGYSVVRRGSFDDAAVSLRPHLRSLAQRRRSAPSLVFGKALGMSWSPIREEASCWVSVDQSPFVLGLASESGELLLDECVQVTEGSKTKERHLFLFKDVIVFAKLKSNSGYRLKNRVVLQDIWMYGFEDDPVDEEEPTEEIDLRVTLVLAWALTFCLVCFRSPEVKERWLETLHRKISQAKSMVGCVSQPPDVLMKVLSGSITPKTLSGGGMEDFIEIPLNGDAKLNNQEEKLLQTIETRWKLVRKLRKGSSFISRACRSDTDTKTQLFGQPLAKICPDNCSLPKPLTEILLLLRKKGPSTEGVFRKPCNIKNMRDIRERLNSGIEVDMDIQPVCLLVGLLKNFMKDIPGSLLVSELYIDWMKALDNEETQQRAREIRTVVDKLPGANKLLLQHLVCVLHHILEGADTNKMDAYNLAVCIAPTLLQSDCTPLEEQKDKVEKVTELTRFLIEHSELLGENIPNLLDTADDSVSSKHHDSEYDRTDPDGDGEAVVSASSTHGEGGSSSSLSPPSANASTWPADSIFNTKPGFNRRCSEPILLLSPDLQSLCSHTRSHEDCSVVRRDFEEQPLKKQISDESFLLRGQGGSRPITSFRKLSSSLNVDPLPYMIGNHTKDCSCSSLESAASNHSEGSLFTVSPTGSPACRRVNVTNKLSVAAKAQKESAAPLPDEKRRSQTMRVTNKVLMRTRSVGAHSRSSLKKDSQRENSFPCETLREDCQNEAAEPLLKPRPLSAIEVFKLADSRLPCRPPSYEHAVQNTALPPQYRSMTVHDAIELERRSRPSSVNYDFPSSCSVNQCIDNFAQTAQEKGDIVQRRQPFRRRVMSETVSAGHCEAITRRCSQPVFEEFSYAKESYI